MTTFSEYQTQVEELADRAKVLGESISAECELDWARSELAWVQAQAEYLFGITVKLAEALDV